MAKRTAMTPEVRKQFTVRYLETVEKLPDRVREAYHALVMAAIDECNGDGLKALDVADSILSNDQHAASGANPHA